MEIIPLEDLECGTPAALSTLYERLASDHAVIIQLSNEVARQIRLPLNTDTQTVLDDCLEQQKVGSRAREWLESNQGQLEVDAACFPERAQFRCSKVPSECTECTDKSTLGICFEAMDKVAAICLGHLCDSAEIDLASFYDHSSSLLDVFHYSPQHCPWDCPCPAHQDKGFITAVADSTSALEVKLGSDGPEAPWTPVVLDDQQIVILVNRELEHFSHGTLRACTHRVKQVCEKRLSLVHEIRPNAKGLAAVQRAIAEACEASDNLPTHEGSCDEVKMLFRPTNTTTMTACAVM